MLRQGAGAFFGLFGKQKIFPTGTRRQDQGLVLKLDMRMRQQDR